MKKFSSICSLLFTVFFMLLVTSKCLRVTPSYHIAATLHDGGDAKFQDEKHIHNAEEVAKNEEVAMELYPTGSSLPDCSHACGPCSPCKRVTVSFKCSIAESCPMVYRCTCNGRFYHVPSN
ncbi:hypothetical protein ACFE04_006033 [Oxalis oulophora]